MKYNFEIDLTTDNSNSLILQHIKPGTRVLEFGPATGYLTRYMKEVLNCCVCCIEIDREAAKIAENYCHKMIVTDIDRMDWVEELARERFDYIILADVLEHLKDPWHALEKAAGFLKENGSVITSIPNVGHNAVLMELLQDRFDYRTLGLLDDTHLRFFTRKSILELLNRAGLVPVQWQGTTVFPENTEFKQAYSLVPKTLQSILKNRENGHVYQFVTVSKRKEDVTGESCTDFSIPNSNLKDDCLRFYWAKNGEFSETQSITIPLEFDSGFGVYDINLPSEAEGILRLDPGNYFAYMEIKSISIYSGNPDDSGLTMLMDCSAVNNFKGLSPGTGIVSLAGRGIKRFLSITDDPQLLVGEIPGKQGDQNRMLRVEMNIFSNIPANLSYEINDIYQQLLIKEQLIEILYSEIETANREIQKVNSEVQKLNNEVEKRNGELARLQMDLLTREDQFHQVINSNCWKITAPLRWTGQRVKKVKKLITNHFAGITRRRHEPVLTPLKQIRKIEAEETGTWESLGDDPQFLIDMPLPEGWVLISWTVHAEYPLRLRLYFDAGNGFSESNSMDIATVIGSMPVTNKVLIHLEPNVQRLRLDPGDTTGQFKFSNFEITQISRLEVFIRALQLYVKQRQLSVANIPSLTAKGYAELKSKGIRGMWQKATRYISPTRPGSEADIINYELWARQFELTHDNKEIILKQIDRLTYRPLISIVLPVYNVNEKWLRKCIESVQAQLYSNWELCIADDASTKPHVKRVLEEYSHQDTRIKVIYREKNGHISTASNSALELAKGEFVALLDHDDELTPDALYENAVLLNQHPDADMIYSDEDKINEDGQRHSPFFKPDWSPDTFLSQMYTCHLGVYRTKIVRQVSGFRQGFEGSQDYDLVLRVTELTNRIYHIPKILYHWRAISESTALNADSKGYAHKAGRKSIKEALLRRGGSGWVDSPDNYANLYRVHYKVENNPLISIIIPTRDMPHFLSPCLESIFNKSQYQNYEVIVIDNGSNQHETFDLFTKWQSREPDRFKVTRIDIPFNYSTLNNEGARLARGELLLLLNNDIEVITGNWLEEMAGYALRPHIGAVGAKLLYPDQTVQHCGVVLGIGGVAGHGHKGFSNFAAGYFGALLKVTNVSAVTGACLMVRKELFEIVGGLSQGLAVAFNDVDFCLKLLTKGYYNVVLPQVELYHYESKTRGYEDTPEKKKRFQQEILVMQERWGNLLANDPFYNPNLTRQREDFSLRLPGQDAKSLN